MFVLEIDSVILEYNSKKILQDVYFKCNSKSIVGILGRNGCGKSSLLKIIFGDIKAQNQSIRINSIPISYCKKHIIRYLPQFSIAPKNLKISTLFNDFNLNFDHFLDVFPEYEKFKNSKINSLCGGEKRIIEVYVLLTSTSDFCLLDEPFSQIMPIHIEKIQQLILKEKQHKGIIITDHLYWQIIDICDDIYVIKDGKTYLTQSVQDIEDLGYIKLDS